MSKNNTNEIKIIQQTLKIKKSINKSINNIYLTVNNLIPEKAKPFAKLIAILTIIYLIVTIISTGISIYERTTKTDEITNARIVVTGVNRPNAIEGFEFSNFPDYRTIPSNIQFRLENLEPGLGNPLSGPTYYYKRVKQIENTCDKDMFFFKNISQLCGLALVEITDEGIIENNCGTTTTDLLPPAESAKLEARFYFDANDFNEIINSKIINKSCSINETIMICAVSSNIHYCSYPVLVPIEYYHSNLS